MPTFRINFTGLCLFVRQQDGSRVDVRFVTAPHDHDHHPAGHPAHFPTLSLPADVPQEITDEEPFPGRAAGRPVHLYLFDTLTIRCAGAKGPVGVNDQGPLPDPPRTEADWSHAGFILNAKDVLPGSRFDEELAQQAAPFGTITLKGGSIAGGVPLTQLGDSRWAWIDTAGRTYKRSFITDKVVYSVDFDDAVQLDLEFRGGDDSMRTTTITLRPSSDVTAWVTHDPYDQNRRGAEPRELEHLDIYARCFVRPPSPPTIRTESALRSPKTGTCPPKWVQL